MIGLLKKLNKRQKRISLFSFLLLSSLILVSFLRDKGVTYELPEISKTQTQKEQ